MSNLAAVTLSACGQSEREWVQKSNCRRRHLRLTSGTRRRKDTRRARTQLGQIEFADHRLGNHRAIQMCAFCLRHTSRRWSVMTRANAFSRHHPSLSLVMGKSADSQTVRRKGGRGRQPGNFPKTWSSRSFDMCRRTFDQFAAPLAGHLTGKCDKIASLTWKRPACVRP